jgi:hypothetical protein
VDRLYNVVRAINGTEGYVIYPDGSIDISKYRVSASRVDRDKAQRIADRLNTKQSRQRNKLDRDRKKMHMNSLREATNHAPINNGVSVEGLSTDQERSIKKVIIRRLTDLSSGEVKSLDVSKTV